MTHIPGHDKPIDYGTPGLKDWQIQFIQQEMDQNKNKNFGQLLQSMGIEGFTAEHSGRTYDGMPDTRGHLERWGDRMIYDDYNPGGGQQGGQQVPHQGGGQAGGQGQDFIGGGHLLLLVDQGLLPDK